MGEQPGPVEDEVERALASMRAGFISGSEQVAAGIASLEEHLADAPFEESEAVRAAIAQIVATHDRLTAQVERLPGASWDRFKTMVGVLKAQQTVLDQLGLLVEQHVLPKQLEDLSVTPFQPAPDRVPEPAQRHETRREESRRVDGYERRPLLPMARERAGTAFRGLAAMVVAGLVISLAPRDKLQDMTARLVDLVGARGGAAPTAGPSATVAAEPPQAPPAAAPASPAKRVPQDVAVATERPSPAPRVSPDQDRPAVPASPSAEAAAAPVEPPASARPAEKRVATPTAVKEPAKRPDNAAGEQFVPVVFTHRDHATVMQALSDLKQQYPNLLIGRKGEVQPVDLGKKGIWHRLVFLPAGPRPEAAKLCDQLMAEGYDRCWVKAY